MLYCTYSHVGGLIYNSWITHIKKGSKERGHKHTLHGGDVGALDVVFELLNLFLEFVGGDFFVLCDQMSTKRPKRKQVTDQQQV